MLSGETAVGDYPVEAVSTMASIIDTTEREGGDRIAPMSTRPHTRAGVICLSAAAIARQLGARYLVTFTESGESARRVARLRSPIPHVALTPNDSVRRALSLSWGVEAHTVERVTETDQMIAVADDVLRRTGLAVPGDTVVIVSGAPLGVSGTINQILVHHVGELDRRA
jgi:pyruvate kinase